MGRYTLWCLNRVARWNQHKLIGALAARGHAVRAGSRARFDRAPLGEGVTRDGVLMHEELACDEYFVPIVVKCVGDPDRFLERFGGALTADGRARFESLRADFPQFYPRADRPAHLRDWREYWKTFSINSAFWHVGMFTRTDGPHAYAGLYEIVAQEARDNGERAVLVGYSQGGLVARFLAWMDEQLIAPEQRAIAAVITVQSPNHGSPLADGANVDNAATGLLGAVTGLLGYPIIALEDPHTRTAVEALVAGELTVDQTGTLGAFLGPPATTPLGIAQLRQRDQTGTLGAFLGPPATTPLGIAQLRQRMDPQVDTEPPYHFSVGAVCALLDAMIRDTPRSRPEKADVLRTCRKWLTGLSPAKLFTAFADLDPRGLDAPGTVLGRLNAAPLEQVFHGAIIGGDPSAEDLLVQQRPWWQRWLIRLLAKRSWFEDLGRPFGKIVMNEAAAHKPPQTPLHAKLAELYRTGLAGSAAEVTLPPFAHDFAIPAVSQALYALGQRSTHAPFLGNRLNAKATHASGADPDAAASDVPFVEEMLDDLAQRLP